MSEQWHDTASFWPLPLVDPVVKSQPSVSWTQVQSYSLVFVLYLWLFGVLLLWHPCWSFVNLRFLWSYEKATFWPVCFQWLLWRGVSTPLMKISHWLKWSNSFLVKSLNLPAPEELTHLPLSVFCPAALPCPHSPLRVERRRHLLCNSALLFTIKVIISVLCVLLLGPTAPRFRSPALQFLSQCCYANFRCEKCVTEAS